MNTIELKNVSVRLGEVDALREASVALDGRTIAVIGDNGSGKSTLARVVGGLVPARAGEVRVLGLDPVRQAAELRRRVAFVFSNPDAQIIMPTVAEDVAFSLRDRGMSRRERSERVAAALDRFGLTELAARSSHDLSGGQKQLLALCGALVREPELVIADEPTAFLDARNARRITAHLFDGGPHRLLLVTHDLSLARRCECAVLVAGGRVVLAGDPGLVIAAHEKSLDDHPLPPRG
ncbi:energy-coupling factor ABC transporter ATP-binding protein [Myceligenerans pegani]|uniref:ABC transporter ATP-binding protein n=1 Tax=Myceligenerans pegani TaxID=2776917 RepID=A0ABR9N5C8_9MICO|nr:ABC transporter ATP-binding protein [Myceligenerans sp. TRM 65318]MBE1878471.1 ABC transporter ATP-binding protein [Myceligenerans sp. TRM 65318]MBE3020742.1 ABC transporter ATP-binding protein [Myceligenerans sp. TRM 65318]